MYALSLYQPWATLVAIGAKRLETRSWYTRYRGPLAIHATTSFPRDCRELCNQAPFRKALTPAGFGAAPRHWYHVASVDMSRLPLGAIVAVCELTGCFATPSEGQMWREYPLANLRLPPEEPEASFGNFGPGRYVWRLENVVRLPEPVPCRGARLLWTLPPDVLAAVQPQLAGVPL